MQIIYHFIILYLTCHFIWELFQEKKFWVKVSVALVLIMLLLRLFLIK